MWLVVGGTIVLWDTYPRFSYKYPHHVDGRDEYDETLQFPT